MNLLFLGKRARIERAIARGDYEKAKEILRKYEKIAGIWSSTEAEDLEKKIKKYESIDELNRAVEECQVKEAGEIFSDLKRTANLANTELTDLEAKMQSISVDGFLRKLSRTKGKDGLALADKIAELYPEAEKEALREGLTEGVSYLLNLVRSKEDFTTVYRELRGINKVLEKHKTIGLQISHLVDIAVIVKTLEVYLESPEGKYTECEGEKSAGDLVKVICVDSGFNQTYIGDRTRNFPPGSVGMIKDNRNNNFYIEFENAQNCSWTERPSISSTYWREGKQNVAAYQYKETIKVLPVNEIDKNKFLEEMKQLQGLINTNYSQEVPKKKRHNPEITEQDKVLPRSD